MHVALLCHNVELAIVVLRSLKASRIRPWIVCNRDCYDVLRASRWTDGVVCAGETDVSAHVAAELIAERDRERAIDQVMASDTAGLHILHDIRGRIRPDHYPMPCRASLDTLDNKASFFDLVRGLGLPTPRTSFHPDRRRIDMHAVRAKIGFPAVIKPINAWSGIGVQVVRDEAELKSVCQGPYCATSVIVQQYIPGLDVGLSLFASQGKSQLMSTFICGPRCGTAFVDIPAFATAAAAIARETKYCGVANFDARIDRWGKLWLLECNPRFFMRLTAARLCGVDFLQAGLPGEAPHGVPAGAYYSPAAVLSGAGAKHLISGDWHWTTLCRSLGELLSDPLVLIVRRTAGIKAAWQKVLRGWRSAMPWRRRAYPKLSGGAGALFQHWSASTDPARQTRPIKQLALRSMPSEPFQDGEGASARHHPSHHTVRDESERARYTSA